MNTLDAPLKFLITLMLVTTLTVLTSNRTAAKADTGKALAGVSNEEVITHNTIDDARADGPVKGTELVTGHNVWWVGSDANRLTAAGGTLTFTGSAKNDILAVGGGIFLNNLTVKNDIFALGRDVVASSMTTDRLIAAGQTFTGTNVTTRDLWAANGKVILTRVTVDGDIFVVGRRVMIDSGSSVSGNAWITGNQLNMSGRVAGNLTASGGQLRLYGQITRNAELFADVIDVGPNMSIGGNLTVDGGLLTLTDVFARQIAASGRQVLLKNVVIEGELMLAGESVTIDSGSRVNGDAVVMADHIDVAGVVEGDVTLKGQHVRLDGRVNGNADVSADRLEIGPEARIAGVLSNGSREIEISPDAEILASGIAGAPTQEIAKGGVLISLVGIGALAVLLLLPASIVATLILTRLMPNLMTDKRETALGRTIDTIDAGLGKVHSASPSVWPVNWPDAA